MLADDLKAKNDPNVYNVAEHGVGLNPNCHFCGFMLEDEGVFGSCHIGIGTSITLGGTVKASCHYDVIMKNGTIVADGKTLMEGVINFNVSSAIETVSSTVRGIYVGIRSKKNTQTKKSTKPTEKVSIPLPTPKTPKIPSMVDSILQDWRNGKRPQLLPMG